MQDKIKQILAGFYDEPVNNDTELREILDSLEVLELIITIEENLYVLIPDSEVEDIKTFKDLVQKVQTLSQKTA